MPNYRPSGTDQWSASGFQSAINMQDAQSKDMEHQFVSGNLVEPEVFLTTYLPVPAGRPPVKEFEFSEDAIDNEEIWAQEANTIPGCKDILEFFDTHNAGSQSEGESRRPDLTAFLLTRRGKKTTFDRVNPRTKKTLVDTKFRDLFRWAALVIERKLSSQDGWRDVATGTKEGVTQVSGRVRGQLICYNLHHFREQPRIFTFQLLLIKHMARIIRWDRAGAVVTTAFDWTKGTVLSDFLTRFAAATPEQRGLDTTVRIATTDEAEMLLQKCEDEDLPTPREPYWVYTVVDDPTPASARQDPAPAHSNSPSPTTLANALDEEVEPDPAPVHPAILESREFVVGRPISNPRAFTGRTSTGFVAYDIVDNDLAYLKDAWYSDDPDILPEGEIYRRLQPKQGEERCISIPTLVCAGDVRYGDGRLQITLSQLQVPDFLKDNSRIRRHTHTRTVVREVGVPMTAFAKVSDLFQLLRDTIRAHRYATERNILHRDISPGNIMINRKYPNARALLVDWDLALDMLKPQASAERFVTGTWQFVSIVLLNHDENHRHDAEDDLESMIWVLYYCLARYTNLVQGGDASVQDFLNATFDYSRNVAANNKAKAEQRKGRKGGVVKKELLEEMFREASADMQPRNTTPALRNFFLDIPEPLLHHVDLRDLQRTIKAKEKEASEDAISKRLLKRLEEDLAKHIAKANGKTATFGYEWLAERFDEAIVEMQKVESTAASSTSSASPGSMRVPDRLKSNDAVGEGEGEKEEEDEDKSGEQAPEAAEEERVVRVTTRGSSKRGSTDTSTDEPANKRATTPRTRSGRSNISGSYRSELQPIEDNSPVKPKP
ncbi:unnamed protein product [Peniophora sp. CBMAI 1063]|nr:unnamed protein product [Peniophora sp. CBMAI 1063]